MTQTTTVEPQDQLDPGASAPERNGKSGAPRWVLGLIGPVVAVVLWEAGARAGLVSDRLMPAPSDIAATLAGLAADGVLLGHMGSTTARVLMGFVIGATVGTLLGAATGVSPRFQALFDPTLQALRNIPSIAWTPLFILWFGIFETSKILMIALGVFFPVYLTLSGAISSVDRRLVEVGRVYGLGTTALVGRILFPASLPTYLIGLRNGLGLGWMFVVAAEFLGASQGLGYLLVDGQQTGRAALIVASIVMFAVLGKLSDRLLAWGGGRLTGWQDGFTVKAPA